ncbi:MAG: PKD domain-containing protein [Phycisphaerae bacterium]|nr:PKD domain-containing protein [Phycisphaerae bacterium]
MALKADGSIVGWGSNRNGQASPPAGNVFVAIAAGGWHSLALKADGSIVGWGYNGYGQASPPAGNDFVAIAAGAYHSLALKADGSIVGWGRSDYGQANRPGGACAGMTYKEVMTDLVDFLAWAQVDGGPGRGGWRYEWYDNSTGYSDNSVAQWPVLGLVAAEQWGIYAPQFVKDELEYWVTYIQCPYGGDWYGGSGYDGSTNMVNIAKTGGLLVEFFYLGDDATTPRAQKALSYVNSHWNQAPSYWDGNKGHPYAMFSVFKGLELMQVPTILNAPANDETPAGDWWGDYCEYLVHTQAHPSPGLGLGYWDGYYYWGPYLATPWYIIILQASVFPVSVDVVVPGAACDITGYEINVHYSVARFSANGTLTVFRDGVLYDTVTLTDFSGEATKKYNVAQETVGEHTWRAVLNVTGGSITTQVEDTDDGMVYATPQVAGIPDQFTPFQSFDLDDFQTCDCADVDWAVDAGSVPDGWTVTIDEQHIATVVAPEGATTPANIIFKATFHWPGIDCTGSDMAMFSPNRPPVADPGKDYSQGEKYYVDEGSSVLLDGSNSYDPDGHALVSYEWDLDDDGTFETPGDKVTFSAANMDGPSEVYVHLKVCDQYGACDVGTAEVEIENVAPTIDALTAPLDPVNINNQPVTVGVEFSDPGTLDTYDVTWDWGDETSDMQVGATSPASAGHTYAEPGVYEITVTVTDDDGGSTNMVYQYVVVYDPNGGFVTGGGWFDSPAGAYRADPDLTGKATFGFVSKYQKGATIPTGVTEFQFHAGDLNFHSSSYNWLVIAGARAQYMGTGTINGAEGYSFILTAIDGQINGGGGTDKFRIRIWGTDSNGMVYDNMLGAAQTDTPTTVIGGGSILIHK